ncbi:phage recombination protein Bet, partial [Carboxydocella sp. ULO1]|uniref:phage recombination protein Bet n=1 Tax=Carboxydocella sp. ULO1 TaxID=1926599 RepID=UPI0009ADBC42
MNDKSKALAVIEYETDAGAIKLSPETVKRYLVNGEADKITDQEVMMFLALCKYQKLNPFLREAYLIKYGNEPATIVTGKETFTKRAAKNELCTGWQAGIIVQKKDGNIDYRNGTLVLPNEELVGGWARVSRKDWKEPLEITVSLKEYERRKKDGTPMRNWKEMPATMIRKVALVQALREAFPETFQGMYSPEEMPIDDSQLPTKTIDVDHVEQNSRVATDQSGKITTQQA